MSALQAFAAGGSWLPVLAALAAKATLVLLLTAAAAALLWRASAATRHLVWCLGVAGVLALPLLAGVLPAWEVPLLPAASAAAPVDAHFEAPAEAAHGPALDAPATASAALTDERGPVSLPALAAALGAAGVLVGMLWLALGFWGVARVGRRAEVVRDPEWLRIQHDAAERLGLRRPVLLLKSRGPAMPATWGLLWPSVVLPSSADGWSEELRRAVLAHELAHVKRFDCLTQTLAQLACVLFWWHPAVWYAARRLRVERERACDDLVLGSGARASDYAAHLLEVARAHRGMRLAAPAMVSMARPSHLESRLLWVLDGGRPRGTPSARARLATVAAALLLVAPLAAMRPARGAAPELAAAPAEARAARAAEDTQAPPPPAPLPAWIGADAPLPPSAPAPVPADTPDERRRHARSQEAAVERLIEMRAVGVTPAYVEQMRGAGYADLTHDQLVSLRAVGVTPAYVAELRSRGYTGLSPSELTGMRAVGVTPAYIDEMSQAGFGRLSAEMLTGMRAVGVTSAWLAELRRHGVVPRHAGEAKGLRAVGVTGAYAERMRALGLGPLDAEALTGLRALGVTPEYVRELESVGLRDLSVRRLSELKAHGVTAAWVREMEAAGFGPLTADQLVRLRVSGVDRELLRSRRRTP